MGFRVEKPKLEGYAVCVSEDTGAVVYVFADDH